MIVYVVILEDRHGDPMVKVFSTVELAINYAKRLTEYYPHKEDNFEKTITPSMTRDGWLYYAILSCESDNVKVLQRKIDEKEI